MRRVQKQIRKIEMYVFCVGDVMVYVLFAMHSLAIAGSFSFYSVVFLSFHRFFFGMDRTHQFRMKRNRTVHEKIDQALDFITSISVSCPQSVIASCAITR